MKFCTSCGTQIDDNANACPVCGAMQDGAQQMQGMHAQGAPVQGGYPGYTAAPARSGRKISIGGIVAAVGYLLMIIALFLPLFSNSYGFYTGGVNPSYSISVWGLVSVAARHEGLIMVIILIPLIILFIGLVCALIAIFIRNRMQLLLVTVSEVTIAVLAIAAAVIASVAGGEWLSLTAGFYVWIVGTVLILIGAILDYALKKN
ncbi:MAG: zinc ribbon domain-containing protein [Lachnospiraceae bacterium]|nr:zinc ribbon domain-containing protein [Lachnospiraceae bacterium]